MAQEEKLSLSAAILINLNIMLGAGIFINTVKLSKWAGALGCLMYPLIGLLMLPLIVSIAKLVNIYPDAGFYGYGARAIHPFVDFLVHGPILPVNCLCDAHDSCGIITRSPDYSAIAQCAYSGS